MKHQPPPGANRLIYRGLIALGVLGVLVFLSVVGLQLLLFRELQSEGHHPFTVPEAVRALPAEPR